MIRGSISKWHGIDSLCQTKNVIHIQICVELTLTKEFDIVIITVKPLGLDF